MPFMDEIIQAACFNAVSTPSSLEVTEAAFSHLRFMLSTVLDNLSLLISESSRPIDKGKMASVTV